MARNIAANLEEAWRAVIVLKRDGELVYLYEGIYNEKSTAKARVTHSKNNRYMFHDGWVEKADLIWNKLKD